MFTTVGAYFGFRASRKQPTKRYPYGYGRAEDLAGIAIVAAIWGSALLAGWQSYDKLVSDRGTTHLTLGVLAAVVGIIGNQIVARYKLKVGREIKSTPLVVDARPGSMPWRREVCSSISSAWPLGFPVANPLAGFAITALIVHIGIDAARDVAARTLPSSTRMRSSGSSGLPT